MIFGPSNCLPNLCRRPGLIVFFKFFDEETVVDHPRKAVIRSFYFV
jgi:hypothetical protein